MTYTEFQRTCVNAIRARVNGQLPLALLPTQISTSAIVSVIVDGHAGLVNPTAQSIYEGGHPNGWFILFRDAYPRFIDENRVRRAGYVLNATSAGMQTLLGMAVGHSVLPPDRTTTDVVRDIIAHGINGQRPTGKMIALELEKRDARGMTQRTVQRCIEQLESEGYTIENDRSNPGYFISQSHTTSALKPNVTITSSPRS